jgi:tripartite-type tricarboxylate transporter receptor subunit TctC
MRKGTPRLLGLFSGLFLLVSASDYSFSQDYPTKPINVLVGFAAGGAMDVTSRALGNKAEKFLGQPMIFTNRPGGTGTLAAGIIVSSKPDGYTIAAITQAAFTRTLQLETIPYKLEDFAPIMRYGLAQSGMVVKADSSWKTFKELVEYAKKNPGKVKYGTLGAWSLPHTSMEIVALKEGVKWTHIPFAGSAPATTALLGGHIDVGGLSTEFVPHVAAGKLRLLATHGETRMKGFPDVPTFMDLGYDFINDGGFLFVAPKGTPVPIVKKLDDALRKAMDDPEFIKVMEKMLFETSYRDHEGLRRSLEEAYRVHAERIKILKIPKIVEEKK